MWRSLSLAGCNFCNQTGFFGRIAVFEIMEVNEEIRSLIAKNASTEQLAVRRREAVCEPFAENGIRYVLEGITSVDEMLKASYE